MNKLKFFYILILSYLFELISSKDKLRFVFGIFRHGARAPWNNVDENNIDILGSKWEARSALTGVGKRQHYLIGFKNKEKYSSQLNMTDRNHDEIVLFSTKTSRTMMSIYSEVFGMYPTSTGPLLNDAQLSFATPPIKNFNFTDEISTLKMDALKKRVNPLPLRIFDNYAHFFGLNDPRICKPLEDIKVRNKNSEKFKNYTNGIIKEYGERIIKVIGKSDVKVLEEYDNIYSVFDSFMANYFDGRDLSKFTDNGLEIENFYNMSVDFLHWDQYYINYGDEDNYAGRMSFSPIIGNLIKQINMRIEFDENGDIADFYNPQNPKMMLYSAHDTSLAALTIFFRYMFGEEVKLYYPYFASSYYIEVFKNSTADSTDKDENYYLNILFNEENILGRSISFKDFKNQIENKLISEKEINKYCGFHMKSSNFAINITITIVLTILLISLSVSFFKIKAKRNEESRNTLYSQI